MYDEKYIRKLQEMQIEYMCGEPVILNVKSASNMLVHT